MTYEAYRIIFMSGGVLSAVMLVISIFLFFNFDVIKIIGDLNGHNAKKEVERIRVQNKNSGVKTYKSSAVNLERGRITDKILQSGQVVSGEAKGSVGAMSTSRLDKPSENAGKTTLLTPEMRFSDETTLLTDYGYSSNFVVEREITLIHTDEVIA